MPDVTPDFTFVNGNTADGEQLQDVISEIVAAVNALDGDNLATALAAALGVNATGTDRRGFDEVAAEQTTSSTTYADLATPGPSVAVTVPADGLVAVFAQVTMHVASGTGARLAQVGVHETADLSNVQSMLTTSSTTAETRWSTPTEDGIGNGSNERQLAGAIVFPATAGVRTYKLQYKQNAGTGGTPTFSARRLWVWTLGF